MNVKDLRTQIAKQNTYLDAYIFFSIWFNTYYRMSSIYTQLYDGCIHAFWFNFFFELTRREQPKHLKCKKNKNKNKTFCGQAPSQIENLFSHVCCLPKLWGRARDELGKIKQEDGHFWRSSQLCLMLPGPHRGPCCLGREAASAEEAQTREEGRHWNTSTVFMVLRRPFPITFSFSFKNAWSPWKDFFYNIIWKPGHFQTKLI